ncbi:MAG: M23 family metallopeptidase [Alphaproteobacteria bacterium]|nr:M23 family metallopeptidase [Alphaproteobacteria bacterium]
MKILKSVKRAIQQSKVFRYRTYKKISGVGHRQATDRIVFTTMISLLTIGAVAIFYTGEDKKLSNTELKEQTVIDSSIQEEVHEEFGDDPVIEEAPSPSLADLENKVILKEAVLKTFVLKSGETFSSFLKKSEITPELHAQITETLSSLININTLEQGTLLLTFMDNNNGFLGLAIPSQGEEVVAVIKEEEGSLIPFTHIGQVEIKQERIRGKIDRTFQGSASKAGVPQSVITQITNALSGEFDFRSNMRRGDVFDIIYTKKVTPNGIELDIDKELVFVGLQNGKKTVYRYLYKNEKGISAYYNPRGERGEQTIAPKPVKAIPRLSSKYGWRRHPVLMYRSFHSGADLACPKGTPVYAGADGVITQIGRKGAYGKYIRIKHAGGFETAYGHMSGFKKGLKRGSRVKRGEVIAYVGATGRATGPHLHYEVWKNGKTQNPLQKHVIKGEQLTGFEMDQFKAMAESIHPDYQEHRFGKNPPIPPKKPFNLNTKKEKK